MYGTILWKMVWVHTLDRVIVPQSFLLPDLLAEDSTISIFNEALRLTGLCDSLRQYIDPTYSCGEDSVNQDMVISTGGSSYTMRYVGTRMKRYTAFVETDEVYATANGAGDSDGLKAHAKQVLSARCIQRMPDCMMTIGPIVKTP